MAGSEKAGTYTEVFSTDEPRFGGTDLYHNGTVHTEDEPQDRFAHAIHLKLPPYGACYLQFTPDPE